MLEGPEPEPLWDEVRRRVQLLHDGASVVGGRIFLAREIDVGRGAEVGFCTRRVRGSTLGSGEPELASSTSRL